MNWALITDDGVILARSYTRAEVAFIQRGVRVATSVVPLNEAHRLRPHAQAGSIWRDMIEEGRA